MLTTDYEKCSGCEACYNSCPVKAVSMQENSEGFLYPKIDTNLCVNCHKCEKVCPIGKIISLTFNQKAYAVWCKDENLLNKSSSGGVFGVIARQIISEGGVVCGAAFDENNSVCHIIINRPEDIAKLQGSKYVQSKIGSVYQEIEKHLKAGTKVLFSGTPCQVDGLKNFLSKDYENLLTVDIACHGVPSPKVWRKYLSEIGNKISHICFRNKTFGWRNYSFAFCKNGQQYLKPTKKDTYFRGFLSNLFLRKSCAECQYANLNRPSDITLADFWGIQKYKKSLFNKKGTSLVLVNSSKGEGFFELCRSEFAKMEEVPLKIAIKGNEVFSHPSKENPLRKYFFESLDRVSVSELIASINDNDEYHELLNQAVDEKKIGIMNFHYTHENFGGVMVPYALSTALKKLGYKPEIINFLPASINHKKSLFEAFREKYITRSAACRTIKDLEIVSKNYTTFISGSDQVFRNHMNGKYLFNFISGTNRLISYAASFGKDAYLRKDIPYVTSLLNRFDALSVREKSGVEVMEKYFHQKAVHVLDPTLLLDAKDYEQIIDDDKSVVTHQNYIGKMFLDNDYDIAPIKLDNQTYQIINCTKTNNEFHSVGQWLNNIKNCRYLITDSFHGCVFAIIFKKQFICITRNKGGNSRLESLFATLGIDAGRLLTELPSDYTQAFGQKIDYDKVYKNLEKERQLSQQYLTKALNLPKTYKERLKFYDDIESRYIICGLPLMAKKLNGFKVDYCLFNKLCFLSKEKSAKYDAWYLFGKIKFIKAVKRKNRTIYKVLGLPLVTVKYKD